MAFFARKGGLQAQLPCRRANAVVDGLTNGNQPIGKIHNIKVGGRSR